MVKELRKSRAGFKTAKTFTNHQIACEKSLQDINDDDKMFT